MFAEDGVVFEDNTIVEFRYEMNNMKNWRWVPIRVRNDKTTELRQGLSMNFEMRIMLLKAIDPFTNQLLKI